MALLMVITSILLLTILVAEISRGAAMRLQLAQHHRDEVKAEMLATSGVQMYRLILMASKTLGKNPMIMQFGQMMGVNADSLWQMVPVINTGMMRMLFVTKGDMDDLEGGQLTEEQLAASREKSSAFKRNFLDFDGDFQARVEDENQYIFVGKITANDMDALDNLPVTRQLLGLMQSEDDQQFLYDNNLQARELIANLADWTDVDDLRKWEGGREDGLYERLDSPYRSKNAPFDTIAEIRLVSGWHLDGVWERFGRHLTIYGAGRVNVNTAKREIIAALIQGYTDIQYPDAVIEDWVKLFMEARSLPQMSGGIFITSGQQFHQYMTEVLGVPLTEDVANVVTGESTTFRVTSVGEVGEARVEITAILDYSRDPTGEVLYWSAK
ncbi:MAG: general secretion pathway protein GspK [Alphaproteobacteria bacterium]|nr:general secretion pathway protein GspK [Alphaproteobacteria bacterium]MCB9692114.1 general secretion pathway protein GspK [Alphaproteobacteria bacterium]